jgi:hypothetical protein
MVDENNKIKIREINEKLIETIGTVNITIEINNEKIDVKFNLVKNDFPILKDGILGQPFLTNNKAVIDISNNTIITKINVIC